MLLGIEHPGLTCNRQSFYTSSLNGCDGWSDISFEDCKEKCVNNEIPASCMNQVPPEGCAYMDYSERSRQCHLAGNNCTMSEKEGGIVWGKYEPGKFIHLFLLQ